MSSSCTDTLGNPLLMRAHVGPARLKRVVSLVPQACILISYNAVSTFKLSDHCDSTTAPLGPLSLQPLMYSGRVMSRKRHRIQTVQMCVEL